MSNAFAMTAGEPLGPVMVIRVSGRIDAKTSSEFVDRCLALRPLHGHLVLNLAEVTFLSSSGVGAMMVLSERAGSDGGSLRLVAPPPPVLAPLQLLNLDTFLRIDETESEALAALGV